MNILEIYLLNLAVTVAMFLVLIFRAWIEFKNYKMIWREMEWQRTRRIAREVLKEEKDIFAKIEGGHELYEILCHMFGVEED
ncbi:hypothetical protein CW705_01560 [Candidatus Bathyarchaeota archaeon]|nr:MAG: hypothetical protein CW705_01560 [Candidatus Bathyarchaeota archaeon]